MTVISKVLTALKLIVILLVVLLVTLMLMYFHRSNPSDVKVYETSNPHIHPITQISAHRSGAGIMPEQTLMAFKNCVESDDFTVDIFEFDLRITKDDVLVLLHDSDLDRTSDSVEVFGATGVRPEDKTYAELRQLNMGAKFQTADGQTPYAGLTGDDVPDDIKILSLDELFDYLEPKGSYGYIIEIKNGGELGKKALDILYATLYERGILDRAIFGTFQEDIARYAHEQYPYLLRGASPSEVLEFYIASVLNRQDYVPTFNALQLPFGNPQTSMCINLGTARVINYAHAHNLAVQYWTIDRQEDMRYLISIGADAIMSDYPDIAFKVRAETR